MNSDLNKTVLETLCRDKYGKLNKVWVVDDIKEFFRLGVVAHVCNLSIREVEAGRP